MLSQLRNTLSKHSIKAYVVPTRDPHDSEYTSPHHARRAFITGFTGSAGTALITDTKAVLWTDGRYTLQAEDQVDSQDWEVRIKPPDKGLNDWLVNNLNDGDVVGIDPQLMTVAEVKAFQQLLTQKGIIVKTFSNNFIDEVWENQPAIPSNEIWQLPLELCGQSMEEKVSEIREDLKFHDIEYYITSVLDEIAWVMNLRGKDIDCNQVFFSYLIISHSDITLFVDSKKFNETVQLKNVLIKPYESFFDEIKNLDQSKKVLIDPTTCNYAIYERLNIPNIVEGSSLIEMKKAIKNSAEIKGFETANVRDGIALCKFYTWLEQNVDKKKISEVEIADKLLHFRKLQKNFIMNSFPAIVGYGPNGAIIHYHAEQESCAIVGRENLLLIDSGGSYLEGLTDTTRTIHLGEPTEEQKFHFTLVLKGHIALDQAIFAEGTTGAQLDFLARQYLYQHGLEFYHGTGHGVGLVVHEGPQGITKPNRSASRSSIPFAEGMTTSNEPGFYANGKYGIRIENVLITKKSKLPDFQSTKFLSFECWTKVPLQTKLIAKEMLSEKEIDWVNKYNRSVEETLAPLLSDDPDSLSWLKKECKPF